MGSPFHLIFYSNDSAKATGLATAAFQLVDSFNAIFSDYLQNSELNRLSKTAGSQTFVLVSPSLYDIIALSKKASHQSRGAFDITVGPLSRLWRQARKDKRFPAKEEVVSAKESVGMKNILVDSVTKKVQLLAPAMQLDLGGIAKGYVAERVIRFLQANGIRSALVDAGGDLVCTDPPPNKKGWMVGINLPESPTELLAETLEISNSAIATSGDLYQYIEHMGKRYSHIIDPRSGYGVPYQRNVTIIAPDGATADWLATACSILPLRQCKKLAKRVGAQLLITQIKGGKLHYYMSREMKKRLRT